MPDFLLTEGDLDRGRPPDLTSPDWYCGIVDPEKQLVPSVRSDRTTITWSTRATQLCREAGTIGSFETWSGGHERATVIEEGCTWTRVPGTDVEICVLGTPPVALRYQRRSASNCRQVGIQSADRAESDERT